MEDQPTIEVRELDHRFSDRLDVTLWWVKGTLDTYVHVVDHKTEPPTHHYVDVRSYESPNDVFQHPFAYLGQRALDENIMRGEE